MKKKMARNRNMKSHIKNQTNTRVNKKIYSSFY